MNHDESSSAPGVVYRKDYRPPNYWVDHVELEFDLAPRATVVVARLQLTRNEHADSDTLELNGEQLQLLAITVDGKPLPASQFVVTGETLTLHELPEKCVLETRVQISPETNKALSGLYLTSGNYCTQCEAMGFRRITYHLDRPDVMATYEVTIRGDKSACPVMLSNGNRVSHRDLDNDRHEVVWEDPFPKPSYLFALVAGDLRCHRGSYTTISGQDVALEIWVEPQNIDKCEHALVSLQKSMKWDEETFGLEYDLAIYMIVAVNDFNMGAMENKGLNVFNSKYVLALPETATDEDYLLIEAVIAHEYFHNWTGNRVTCRDWFQLTLKEGLTVFRDQQFTADQTSAAVKRIDDVAGLRARQFVEDSGPMAHPIRPESYLSMDNFYTATVYRKGAEIIRMYHTVLGAEGFRRGMDLYFQRHDNQAVTCDDFRAAMADANGINLDQFDRWYAQAGTPVLTVAENWNESQGQYTLELQQAYPELSGDLPGTLDRQPVPLPIQFGLLDRRSGRELEDHAKLLMLEESQQTFVFDGLSEKPVASILRDFSAPVRLRMERSDDELAFLMSHDTDPFNRWDAGQSLATQLLVEVTDDYQSDQTFTFSDQFRDAFGQLLQDDTIDEAFKAVMLVLPSESVIAQEVKVINPDAIHAAREFYRTRLAEAWFEEIDQLYHELANDGAYQNDQRSINRRRLKNVLLAYLSKHDATDPIPRIQQQFDTADNMTDLQAALSLFADVESPVADAAIAKFYKSYNQEPLVVDKWFSVQALSSRTDTLERVANLAMHESFSADNPNRVRALYGAFAQNPVRFHQADGRGYEMLAEFILNIESKNPQVAARLASAMNSYRRYDSDRQSLMEAQLHRIADHAGLCKDVKEIVDRALRF